MTKLLPGLIIGVFVSLVGCDSTPAVDPANGTASEAANVEMEQDKDEPGSVSVIFPAGEVSVDNEKGVEVRAPGTAVRVSEKGIDIKTPNVEIRTTPGTEEQNK